MAVVKLSCAAKFMLCCCIFCCMPIDDRIKSCHAQAGNPCSSPCLLKEKTEKQQAAATAPAPADQATSRRLQHLPEQAELCRQENSAMNQPGSSRFSSHPSADSIGTPNFGYQSPFQQVADQGWASSTQPSQGRSSKRSANTR